MDYIRTFNFFGIAHSARLECSRLHFLWGKVCIPDIVAMNTTTPHKLSRGGVAYSPEHFPKLRQGYNIGIFGKQLLVVVASFHCGSPFQSKLLSMAVGRAVMSNYLYAVLKTMKIILCC